MENQYMQENVSNTMPSSGHENMPEKMMPNPMEANPSLHLQPTRQLPVYPTDKIPKFTGNMANQIVYPELFYKLQPFIIMACDQMDTYSFGTMIPTQDMVEQLSDNIHDDVCRIYPDIAEYADSIDRANKGEQPVIMIRDQRMFDRNFDMLGHRFTRRGVLRDLINILLISELFRRRRRFY